MLLHTVPATHSQDALIARKTDSEPAVLRRRCCYCPDKHAMDGLGPIVAGELVSDGICAVQLARLTAELDARPRA